MEIGRRLGGLGASARSAVAASGSWMVARMSAYPGPVAVPVGEPWEFSVGALIARHPRVPKALAKPLGALDGLGSVRIGPEGLGFDGEDDVPWEKIVHIRLHNGVTAVAAHSIEAESERLRALLPPLPGRRWALGKIAGGLKTLVAKLRERSARRRDENGSEENGSEENGSEENGPDVACEFVTRGLLGRERTVRACMYTTAFLALRPDVSNALVETARAAGVPVLGSYGTEEMAGGTP
ncbi:hypothetical protein [Streptomyces sp. NBC_01803]|uniref:hypothetical protein n=1 Tax=Streptomyces sp. NBC_01803 TaxID=2975946 RepID=UPI002DD7B07D|nr:hypothetical protein [Streptomyces sp. NBC_01803]WSA46128.1 hypothetical protein OIE51_19190 [Streptomyces sp. NBC_01803]